MAHRDDIADNIPLAKGLDHPDEGQEYFHNTPNQSDLYPLLPDRSFHSLVVVSLTVISQAALPYSVFAKPTAGLSDHPTI